MRGLRLPNTACIITTDLFCHNKDKNENLGSDLTDTTKPRQASICPFSKDSRTSLQFHILYRKIIQKPTIFGLFSTKNRNCFELKCDL